MAEQENLDAVTLDGLTEKFGDAGKAREVYDAVAKIGGYGSFGADFVGGLPALDINGLSDSGKKAVADLISAAKPKKADK